MIRRARSRGLPTTPTATALLTILLVGVTSAHAGSVTIAWDPSPDPSVAGYRIYVGTASGVYTETFDVGNVTTFSYSAVEGQTYYVAVAAYSPGPVIGPRSSEVSATAGPGSPQGDAASFWSYLWATRSTTSRLQTLDSPMRRSWSSPLSCWEPLLVECLSAQTIGRVSGSVASLAATPDGRLFFVEGGRDVRVIAGLRLAHDAVIALADPATTFNQVAVDPTFTTTGFIWVSETETSAEGRRRFTIARYRVVNNRGGERDPVISGITLPPTGNALFAIDASGSIYVAVPGSPGSDPYGGMVLRFNADGSIPETGSAVIGTGYTFPHAIALEAFADRVWLTGVDSQGAEPSRASEVAGFHRALSFLPHGDHEDLLTLTGDGALRRESAAHVRSPLSLDLSAAGRPLALAVGPGAQIYLSLHTASTDNPISIIRLLPMR